jgi:hypothetical protein
MPLNIKKLQGFLAKKEYIPTKYFVKHNTCLFIELFCCQSGDVIVLYIPSKYEFPLKADAKSNIFKLEEIDMKMGEYVDKTDDKDYADFNIELTPKDNEIEDQLENNYHYKISIKNINKGDIIELASIYRQLRRLRYCVSTIKYKIATIYKNYFCAIRRDDTISCFTVKHYPQMQAKRLLIVVDLETLYDKDHILTDIQTVRDSIYRVLEKNQGMHARILNKMIENKQDIILIPQYLESKVIKYDDLIHRYTNLLKAVSQEETTLIDKLKAIKNNTEPGIATDIDRIHRQGITEKDLEKTGNLKGEITKNIILLRSKRENIILSVDNILFDNSVMFDKIIQNFAQMKDYCS